VSDTWIVVIVVSIVTIVIKALGPMLLGGKPLPQGITGAVVLLAPALLAALVVTQTVGTTTDGVVVDGRLAGVAAAGVGIAARQSVLVVVVLAAGVTALVRALA
jgi:branched-subunit amino acid transport protein